MNLSRIPLLVWFLIPTIIIMVAGVFFFSKSAGTMEEGSWDAKPVAVSNPVEGTVEYEIVGRNHIGNGIPGSGYNTNPPTSGPHWGAPARNGIYDSPLADEQAIHNLEHGHVQSY